MSKIQEHPNIQYDSYPTEYYHFFLHQDNWVIILQNVEAGPQIHEPTDSKECLWVHIAKETIASNDKLDY